MDYFQNVAGHLGEFQALSKHIGKPTPLPLMVTGLSHIHKAHFLAALVQNGSVSAEKPLLVLCDAEQVCRRICADMNTMAGKTIAAVFPAKDFNVLSAKAVSGEYIHQRLGVLSQLANHRLPVVLASPDAVLQYTIPKDTFLNASFRIEVGEDYSMEDLVRRLVAAGYTRRDMIEGTAQFSVRGSLLDVFLVHEELPVRIEFWGETADDIRHFDLETQRKVDSIESVEISPACELLFENPRLLADKLEELIAQQKNGDKLRKTLQKELESVENGMYSLYSDRYLPLAYTNPGTIFSYTHHTILCESVNVQEAARAVSVQHKEDMELHFEQGTLCKGLDRYYLSFPEYQEAVRESTCAMLETFSRKGPLETGDIIGITANQLSAWSGEYKVLTEELNVYMAKGYSVLVFAGTEKNARTVAQDLRDAGMPADYSKNPSKLLAKRIYITAGTLSAGFDYPETKCAVLTHTAVSMVRTTAPKRKKGEEIRALSDINAGDLVVHNSYGIGIFEGVQKLTEGKVSKDYIKIRYAGTDVLYVPVTQLDLIARYVGSGDASTVKLNKLHSDQWKKAKTKAKTAASEMAQELIELYQARMRSKGFAFSPDNTLQEDFENHFNYVETEDQLRCTAEIKADMQRPVPMDRLLCGDVGFGKTEVALRAAFKCYQDGKQCALLCPTTVLAWQHYQTVIKRTEGFGMKIQLLSRFRSPKEQKEILKKLASGELDMIVGTHRIVQNDVKFKDLGLVIIDEEQRFGVAHKEKFKEMFHGVDILTLSATPIPRTLNMAMTGIRDMSIIGTPPLDRQPITTYVLEHDWGVLTQAINKELRRGGQVYYVHNRIESIYQCAAKLHELIPNAVIGVAHGRMEEDELLEVWRKLLGQEIDILVCTTLIETGVDVPNCNTLIIENADYMGLAQLHQLRGRVGRTSRRAFAYFTFRRGKTLSEIATKRLSAIREFTQFGSGFRIAMRDLEIRGAGSILGKSQSGHMSAVGYDMYLKLLGEAVREQRGEKPEEKDECLIDIKIDAYIPEKYISNQAQRINCYKRIAMIRNKQDAQDVKDELLDRYGKIPNSVNGLIQVALLRSTAKKAGIPEIVQQGERIVFYIDNPDIQRLSLVSQKTKGRVSLNLTGRSAFSVKPFTNENPLTLISTILTAYLNEEEED